MAMEQRTPEEKMSSSAEIYKKSDKLHLGCGKRFIPGVLRLAVPDFGASASLYVSGKLQRGLLDVTGLICGGQRDQYDYHKMIFDEEDLANRLLKVGFAHVRHWDWKTTEHAGVDDYSQAYLPHLDKDNGTLVSLNLEGVKE
jgi:hypothetical protein